MIDAKIREIKGHLQDPKRHHQDATRSMANPVVREILSVTATAPTGEDRLLTSKASATSIACQDLKHIGQTAHAFVIISHVWSRRQATVCAENLDVSSPQDSYRTRIDAGSVQGHV